MPVGSSPLVLVFLTRAEVEAFASSCSTHLIGVHLFLGELRLGGVEGEVPSGGPEAIRSFLRGKHPQQLCA